jgi:hypothetical protein
MSNIQVNYTGDGATVLYTITFDYLRRAHVKASINGSNTIDFTFANDTTLQFNSAPANGAAISLFRETSADAVDNTFFPNSSISSESLNDNFLQTLLVSEEAREIAAEAQLGNLVPGSIGTAALTDGAVTSVKIANNTIVNEDINASAAIADTKLATIATAGKVSNSATTATSSNTVSAIVARDGSGNFSAGTITAALTGAASSNVLKSGDTMTGALVVPLASAATPSLTFTGDLNTGVFSPGADQVAISTNGVERVEFGTTEVVFNDGGADVDFRIEGDTKANLFKVDAGADTVIIDGLTHPSADGTADQAVVTNGSGVLSFATRARSVQATAVASTSGTSIDFTSIPGWVTRVTVMLAGVSTNGTSSLLLQIGDSGGIENTGYTSYSGDASGNLSANLSTAGFILTSTGIDAVMQFHGDIVITRLSGNTWVASNTLGTESIAFNVFVGAGSKTLSDVLDRVRLTTVGGANTFDAGTINIMYEG